MEIETRFSSISFNALITKGLRHARKSPEERMKIAPAALLGFSPSGFVEWYDCLCSRRTS